MTAPANATDMGHAAVKGKNVRDSDRYVMVYDDVFQALKGTTTLSIYMALKRRVNFDGGAWYSTREILAEEAGISANTFDTHVKKLAAMGLVDITPRFVPVGWIPGNEHQVSEARTKATPEQRGNSYAVSFHLPENTFPQSRDPYPNVGTPPTQDLGTPPTQDLGGGYTSDWVTNINPLHKPLTRTPLAPQGEAADAAEDGQQVLDAEFVDESPAKVAPETSQQVAVQEPAPKAPAKRSKPKKVAKNAKRTYTPEFQAFWESYPKRPNMPKAKTFDVWDTTLTNPDVGTNAAELIHAARRYTAYCQVTGQNPQFIPHATSWLNSRGWENELFIDPTTTQLSRDHMNQIPADVRSNISMEDDLPW